MPAGVDDLGRLEREARHEIAQASDLQRLTEVYLAVQRLSDFVQDSQLSVEPVQLLGLRALFNFIRHVNKARKAKII